MSEQLSLNAQIATALGYRVAKAQRRTGYWQLIAPNGEAYSVNLFTSESEAWGDAPDCEHSIDASLAALPNYFSVEIYPVKSSDWGVMGNYYARLEDDRTNGDLSKQSSWTSKHCSTRAEALARALLALLTAKGAT